MESIQTLLSEAGQVWLLTWRHLVLSHRDSLSWSVCAPLKGK